MSERVTEKAHQMVAALCAGKERWHMSIPAQPDRDPDLVISNGLRAADKRIAELEAERDRYRKVLTECEAVLTECHEKYGPDGTGYDYRIVYNVHAAIKAALQDSEVASDE